MTAATLKVNVSTLRTTVSSAYTVYVVAADPESATSKAFQVAVAKVVELIRQCGLINIITSEVAL